MVSLCVCIEHVGVFINACICGCEWVCVCGRTLSTDFTLFKSSFIQPAILFNSCHILFCSVCLVSMELICLRLCPPVYSMGRSVGGLERLHHLLLPGRRRPLQGETFKISACCFLHICRHASVSRVGWLCLPCDECSFLSKVMVAGWWGSEAWFIFLCPRVAPPTL